VAIVTAERAACCGASAGALNAKEAANSLGLDKVSQLRLGEA